MKVSWIIVKFLLLSLTYYSCSSSDSQRDDKTVSTTVSGKFKNCKGIWRPQVLRGKCFGLELHSVYVKRLLPLPAAYSYSQVEVVESARECRSICCNLGDECVNWQYQQNSKNCKLGKEPIRYGLESTGTPGWCDPNPTSNQWNGKRLISRDESTGKCIWGKDNLNTQCFGLGAEKLNSTNGRITDPLECAASCCEAASAGNCKLYQELPGIGCFYSADSDIYCDDKVQGAYTGINSFIY